MSLVVTATGTEVGKTVVSALLLARYPEAAYWKPIASGLSQGSDRDTVNRLAPEGTKLLPEGFCFDPPVSPHLAARWAGRQIDPEELINAGRRPGLVIEGIGGVMVPLRDDGYLFLDLLAAWDHPCLLVASSELGTLNHTLLSLAALRARRISVAGVVLNGPPNADNREGIERFGQIEVVAEVAVLDPLTRSTVAKAAGGFDEASRLAADLYPRKEESP